MTAGQGSNFAGGCSRPAEVEQGFQPPDTEVRCPELPAEFEKKKGMRDNKRSIQEEVSQSKLQTRDRRRTELDI